MIRLAAALAIALASASAGVAQPARSEAPRADTPLVGSWELVKGEVVGPNGQSRPLLFIKGGENPSGLLIYSGDGWMSAQIAGANRPQNSRDNPNGRNYQPEVGAAILASYYGYYGRYEVDEAKHLVRHFVSQALHPDEIGQTYERHYEIKGDLLTLSTPSYEDEGEKRFNRLTWRRVAPQQHSTRK